MIPLKSRVDSRLTHQAFECVYEAISGTGTHADIRRQDFVKVRRNLNFFVSEVLQPGSIPASCIEQCARNISQTHTDRLLHNGSGSIVASKQSQAVSHHSSLVEATSLTARPQRTAESGAVRRAHRIVRRSAHGNLELDKI